ncbi:MAG: stage II sporulation protein M [Candidatus Diapherotrites archaeon]|nr:stage II sporulation protein M [Candidatus Diapherotrites archaeon]
MVLEALLTPKNIQRHPIFMLFLAIIVSSASAWIAYNWFPSSASILTIAFITIALMPVVHSLIRAEETREARKPGFAASFIARHFSIIEVYGWFFIGLIISYAFWYAAMPLDARQSVFLEQEKTVQGISDLRNDLSGMFAGQVQCGADTVCWFDVIFANNMGVMASTILLSFVFGAGAIFLIGWNASVLGLVIGKDVLNIAPSYEHLGILGGALAFFHGIFNGIGLIPHGVFEASAYFIAAVAGGIISVAITKRYYYKHELSTIAKDAALLIAIAATLIFAGAVIEAHVIVASL